MQLVDNSLESKIDFTHGKTKQEKELLKLLSNKTIEEHDGILVYPHSFDDCKDKLKDLVILNYIENTSIETFNLIGFVGNGNAQIEIN